MRRRATCDLFCSAIRVTQSHHCKIAGFCTRKLPRPMKSFAIAFTGVAWLAASARCSLSLAAAEPPAKRKLGRQGLTRQKDRSSPPTSAGLATRTMARGAAPAYPILQGQHSGIPREAADRVQSERKRVNAIMQGMASTLSADDMKNVAAFYAGKEAKPGFAKNKAIGCRCRREDLPRRHRRPQPFRRVPAATARTAPEYRSQYPRLERPTRRIRRSPVGGVSRRGAATTSVADDRCGREIERPRDQGAGSDYIAGLY